jgi:ribosomal-protein-alanine N-acetyltransferase
MKDAGDGLATQRLVLQRFRADDLDLLDRIHSDPVVMKHMGGAQTREKSAETLRERMLDYYPQHPGLGIWKTIERSSGECIGFHVLNNIRGATHIQVGYCLLKKFWGRGYATEMCIALLRYGYTDLGITQITAIAELPHVASHRVLLKAGLRRNGERAFATYANGDPMAWFERDAKDWLAEFTTRI